jgi:hypothetical protein
MITLSMFYERLARSELKNMAAVDETNLGEIRPDYLDTVRILTNEALKTITTKLSVIKREFMMTIVEGQTVYTFEDDAGKTALNETYVYEPEEFIRIMGIYDSKGFNHLVNTNRHMRLVRYNRVVMTPEKVTELLPEVRVECQFRHEDLVDESSIINIPPNLETALQLLVASLYIGQMNGPEHTAKGDGYYAAYLRHIGEDELKDTSSVSEIDLDTRFSDRGFV